MTKTESLPTDVIEKAESLTAELSEASEAVAQVPTPEELQAQMEEITAKFANHLATMNRQQRRKLNSNRHYPYYTKKYASQKMRDRAYEAMTLEKMQKWSTLQSWLNG